MLRGEAQSAVQSEIRSILEAITGEDGIFYCEKSHYHDDVVVNLDALNQCELRKPDNDEGLSSPEFNFEEIFAPLCQNCGWVENTCACSISSSILALSASADGSEKPAKPCVNVVGTESSCPPAAGKRGNKRARSSAHTIVEAGCSIGDKSPRRSARRRRPITFD